MAKHSFALLSLPFPHFPSPQRRFEQNDSLYSLSSLFSQPLPLFGRWTVKIKAFSLPFCAPA